MNTQQNQQSHMQAQKHKEQEIIKHATQMLDAISTDWKINVNDKQLLATDPVDNQQGVIATFNGPNHMDITFTLLAPVTIKTLLDLNKRAIAKVKELNTEITHLRDVKNQPDKDYTTQIAMMFGEQNFIEFLIARYQLDENPTTKTARTACEKAFKKELDVKSIIEIKFSQERTRHWLNINREYQQSNFAKKENAA